MSTVLERVFAIAVTPGGANRSRVRGEAALDQDLGIYGDAADDLVEGLSNEFGDWILDWPWPRFVNFNEDAFGRFVAAFWRVLRLRDVELAVPGTVSERLELGHVAAVIEKGAWFEP